MEPEGTEQGSSDIRGPQSDLTAGRFRTRGSRTDGG